MTLPLAGCSSACGVPTSGFPESGWAPAFAWRWATATRCLVFPLEKATGRFLRPLGRSLPVGMKQAPPAASAGYSGSVGLDALQIEHLAVTP